MIGWTNDVGAPSFEELMDGTKEQTPVEKVLVQAIARISVQKGFRDMTPEEVYLMLVEQTEKVHREVR
jgi:hypothetical protein